MQKRARAFETQKLRRAMKCRRGAEIRDSSARWMSHAYLLLIWLTVVLTDFLVGFRIEFLWPVYMLVRSFYDSFQRQNPSPQLGAPSSTLLLLSVTATSDLICYLFIPIQLLILSATIYVWVASVWQSNGGFQNTLLRLANDRASTLQLLTLGGWFVMFELQIRSRCQELFMTHSTEAFFGFLPHISNNTCLQWQGLSPTLPMSVNGFLGAHCVGYPIIAATLSLTHQIQEWRRRRKQDGVSKQNEVKFFCVLVKLLVEALPSIYEGPKLYRREYGIDDDILDDDQLSVEALPVQGQLIPVPSLSTIQNGGGSSTRKTSIRNSTSSTSRQNRSNTKAKTSASSGNSTITATARSSRDVKQSHQEENGYSWVDMEVHGSQSGSAPSLLRLIVDIFARIYEFLAPAENLEDDEDDDDDESVTEERKDRSRNITISTKSGAEWSRTSTAMTSSHPQARNGSNRSRAVASPSATGNSLLPFGGTMGASLHSTNSNIMALTAGQTPSHAIHTNHIQSSSTRSSSTAEKERNGTANGSLENGSSSNGAVSVLNSSARRVRDASRDSSVTAAEEEIVRKECGQECKRIEADCARLRGEVRAARCAEENAILQAQSNANAERLVLSQLSQLQQRMEQLEHKLSTVEKQRDAEKSSLLTAERKIIEMTNKRNDLERELVAERKARKELINGTKKVAGMESSAAEVAALREKEKSYEKELERMRIDSSAKDDIIMDMSNENRKLKEQAAAVDVEVLKMESRLIREKNAHLEQALAAENKLKQELFRALGDAKASNEQLRREQALKVKEQHMREAEAASAQQGISSYAYCMDKKGRQQQPPPAYASPVEETFSAPLIGGQAPTRPCYSFTSQHISSPNGEHTLFDLPSYPLVGGSSSVSPALPCALSPQSDPLIASRMGKFGAPSPSNHSARSN